ncbi:hypothetical protein CCGE525_13410 [Rhizobium jaguaris]|uniref:Lipoprotein n=2 Tax=Rhizobium jaguaris TaxID=1312183 RepID=A0A387FPY1_9HYPH|nr:hypothetical protein CCGE525_13410 [Rhizobium jaguaris]
MRNVALFAALLLSGCTTYTPAEQEKAVQSMPRDYRAQIVDHVHGALNDPFSVKEAEITGTIPVFAPIGKRLPGVCIRFFAKNQYGAYMGRVTYAVSFEGGKLYQVNPYGAECAGPWQPFPELDGKE